MRVLPTMIGLTFVMIAPQAASAWGDDGHKTIALIAQKCLTPNTARTVAAMLAADADPLTKHDLADEATWADKYRDMNNRQDHYQQTQNWHFVDIELDHPDLTAACFGRPPLPAATVASNGPAQACVVDKIKQFETEPRAPMRKNGWRPSNSSFISWATFTSRCTRRTTTTEAATT